MLNFLSLETVPESLFLCTVCPPPTPCYCWPPPGRQLFPLPQNTHWSSFEWQRVERGLLLLIHILCLTSYTSSSLPILPHLYLLIYLTSSAFSSLPVLTLTVSPTAMIAMWSYWFHLSRYVYGGNRSFAPILRPRRWSLLYDVYWLVLMMMNRCTRTGTMGSKYLNTVQDQNCSLLFWTTNNQRIDEEWNKTTTNK
jgi:hypothetical protein